MSREKTDFWVGLFVLLGAIALVFLALRAGNLSSFSFAPKYNVSANFNNVGGLKVGAPIKSAGVTVGRVSSIDFDNQLFQAVVSMSIDEDRKFPVDSSVSILTSGLLGEQYLGIDPGGDEKDLTNGEKITMTQSAVVLENLISQFLYSSADSQGSAPAQAPSGDAAPAPAAAPAAPAAPATAPAASPATTPAN